VTRSWQEADGTLKLGHLSRVYLIETMYRGVSRVWGAARDRARPGCWNFRDSSYPRLKEAEDTGEQTQEEGVSDWCPPSGSMEGKYQGNQNPFSDLPKIRKPFDTFPTDQPPGAQRGQTRVGSDGGDPVLHVAPATVLWNISLAIQGGLRV
jgi:hypothetical protein